VAPDGFGFVVPKIERRQILAGSFASEKFPGRAPSGDILVRVFIGGALAPELAELPEDELKSIAHRELGELLQITSPPLWSDVARWRASMPQYAVGHLQRVAAIETRVATIPGLALAGNAYRGVGIPQCIRSGELAAETITAQIKEGRSSA
jgi:oxygen-dependent protoporphyrinogen oxidase